MKIVYLLILSLTASCSIAPSRNGEIHSFNARMINDLSQEQLSIIGETIIVEEFEREFKVSFSPWHSDNVVAINIIKGEMPTKVKKIKTREGYDIQEVMITKKNQENFQKILNINKDREQLFIRKLGFEMDEVKKGMIQNIVI